MEPDPRVLVLDDGSEIRSRAIVLLAGGVSYRRLGIDSLEALVGRGVFYGAGVIEAPGMVERRYTWWAAPTRPARPPSI